MVNFWYEVIEVENGYQGKSIYAGVAKANSDTTMTTDEFLIKENATFACEYFIKGIDFARNSL